jgi:hypothetical protein
MDGSNSWFGLLYGMRIFDMQTIKAMRTALNEVCRHLPESAIAPRMEAACRILESAASGERTPNGLLSAGRQAIIDEFGEFMVRAR